MPTVSSTHRFRIAAGAVILSLTTAIAAIILAGRPRALTIVDVTPADGAVDVPRHAQVILGFSRPIEEASAKGSLQVDPDTPGFVSVAGRRVAFTPRFGFRGDTAYVVTVNAAVRDRGGVPVAKAVGFRFRTEPLDLVLRASDGHLLRARLGRPAVEHVAGPGIGAFAVGRDGALAYVHASEGTLVIRRRDGGPGWSLALSPKLEVQAIEWAPTGDALLILATDGPSGGPGTPYLVRVASGTSTLTPFGQAVVVDPSAGLLSEALKKSLVEIVYRRESFAFTPDGRAAIVRDRNWDFAVVGLDGARRGSLGPFLAVGNTTAEGDLVAVVDVNPADPALRRRVLGFRVDGRGTLPFSAQGMDSHSPVFAPRSRRVAYATGPAVGLPAERRYAIEVADVTTSVRQRLSVPPPGMTDGAPRWSPDEAWLSFVRTPLEAPARAETWLVPAHGGLARPLAPPAQEARWTP
jgi:Bacterial Ig-like domain